MGTGISEREVEDILGWASDRCHWLSTFDRTSDQIRRVADQLLLVARRMDEQAADLRDEIGGYPA